MRPSDRPTLPLDQGVGSSGAEDFVLARLCLDSNEASDRPTVSSLRPWDHPVLLSSLLFLCNSSDATRNWTVGSSDSALIFTLCTNSSDDCTDACYLGTVGSSDGAFSFSFLSRFLTAGSFLLNLACGILTSLGPRNVYKDMINNMVSPIDHVVMNHQNQTRTNDLGLCSLQKCMKIFIKNKNEYIMH
jgi:hypothetical protein